MTRCCALVALVLLAGAGTASAAPVLSGPPGGGVRRIVVAPSDGRIAYAATAGSLFLTRDGGRHWRLVPGRLATPLNLFAVDPTRPSVVYASAGHSETGERLVVSRDSGRHWRLLGRLHAPGLGPGWLVVDPRRPRHALPGALELHLPQRRRRAPLAEDPPGRSPRARPAGRPDPRRQGPPPQPGRRPHMAPGPRRRPLRPHARRRSRRGPGRSTSSWTRGDAPGVRPQPRRRRHMDARRRWVLRSAS